MVSDDCSRPILRAILGPCFGVTPSRGFATLPTVTKECSNRRRPLRVFLSYAYDDAALAGRFRDALADRGLEVSDPDRDHLPGENWAGEVARALEESEAMVVLLTPAAVGSPHVKRNIEYALGAKNYSNRLIPVVVGGLERLPAAEVPWIVRRMPWFDLDDTDTGPPKVAPIAEAILSQA